MHFYFLNFNNIDMGHISFFGSTIRETVNAFKTPITSEIEVYDRYFKSHKNFTKKDDPILVKVHGIHNILSESLSGIRGAPRFEDKTKAIMRIVVTLLLLAISFYLLIEKNDQSKTLPCSIISAISGYWLK